MPELSHTPAPSLESVLRAALARQELTVVYQPQMALGSGRLVGLQALLRFNSSALGLIRPRRFLPVAESTGLIHPIGAWLLEQVCAQLAQWRDTGPQELTVAVKVSSAQFWHVRLLELVGSALARHQLPAGRLMLDLPSLAQLGHTLAALQRIKALGALGVRLSMGETVEGLDTVAGAVAQVAAGRCDDRVPRQQRPGMAVDVIKIEGCLVEGIGLDRDTEHRCSRLINRGRSRGLTVVAEGVATRQQARFLLDAGCHAAQGYRFSAPLLPHEVRCWLVA